MSTRRRAWLWGLLLAVPLVCAEEPVQLEGMSVIGNKELPKALYIVPWKAPEMGDLQGRPVGSLIDDVIAPVDREVFLRELEYYEASRAFE